jgi:hypothetical protein
VPANPSCVEILRLLNIANEQFEGGWSACYDIYKLLLPQKNILSERMVAKMYFRMGIFAARFNQLHTALALFECAQKRHLNGVASGGVGAGAGKRIGIVPPRLGRLFRNEPGEHDPEQVACCTKEIARLRALLGIF